MIKKRSAGVPAAESTDESSGKSVSASVGKPVDGSARGYAPRPAGVLALAALSAALLVPGLARAQDQTAAGDAEAGLRKNSMCIGCHEIPGYKSSFPSVYHVPRIIGQNAAYIAAALGEYRSGKRNHPTMTIVAEALSDRDIADLAAYYGSR